MGGDQTGQRAEVVAAGDGVVDRPGTGPADVGVERHHGVDQPG